MVNNRREIVSPRCFIYDDETPKMSSKRVKKKRKEKLEIALPRLLLFTTYDSDSDDKFTKVYPYETPNTPPQLRHYHSIQNIIAVPRYRSIN